MLGGVFKLLICIQPHIYVLIATFGALVLGLLHSTVQLARQLTAKDMFSVFICIHSS